MYQMPREEVSDHWKSILVLQEPRFILLSRSVGYDYNLKVIYGGGLNYEYKYNVNKDMSIDRSSIDIWINGKFNRTVLSLSSNEREEKLLSYFITFLYSCHNNPEDWKVSYNAFTYDTYKLLKKLTCIIL